MLRRSHYTPSTVSFTSTQKKVSFSSSISSFASTSFFYQQRRFASSSIPTWVSELRSQCKATPLYDTVIYDELAWRKMPYKSLAQSTKGNNLDPEQRKALDLSTTMMHKLCLGDVNKEYTLIGESMLFADRNDSPAINEPAAPAKLYWDHSSPTDKLLIQLSPAFPPLLWLSIRPTYSALKGLLGEFLEVDSQHMKTQLPVFEEIQNSIETQHKEKFGENLPNFRMKDAFMERMRSRDPRSITMDWEREHSVYMGTSPHFVVAEENMRRFNPFVFGWPLMLSEGNHFLENTAMRMAAFRTVYSKSLVLLNSRLDLQVDPRLSKVEDDDEPDVLLDVPVFATINYPKNTRLCGGGAFVKRFNDIMETSFPLDTPVDVLGLFIREEMPKGLAEMKSEVKFLENALEKTPDAERVIRLAPDQHGSSRMLGRLAFNVVYCALLEDPNWEQDLFAKYCSHPNQLMRVALAKGAMILMRQDLVEKLIDMEREPRTRKLMQMCFQHSNPGEIPEQ